MRGPVYVVVSAIMAAMLLGILLFKEYLNFLELFGIATALSGVLINRRKPPPLVVQEKVLPLQAGPQQKSSNKF